MIGPIASSFQRFLFHLTPSLVSQPWLATSLTPMSMPFLISHMYTFFSFTCSHFFSIISVSSYTAVLSRPDSGRDKIKERPPHPSEEGTWFGFFFKLFLLAGVVAGGYYGYQEYLRRQMYGGGGGFRGFTEMFTSNSHRYWMWFEIFTSCPVICISCLLHTNYNSFYRNVRWIPL